MKYYYAGSYADQKGIYKLELNETTGELKIAADYLSGPNPSFLTYSKKYGKLYAVNEVGDETSDGQIACFDVDKTTGDLTEPVFFSSQGAGPCHLAIDEENALLACANYDGGSVGLIALNEKGLFSQEAVSYTFEGSGPNRERQESSHVHSTFFYNNKLYVTDLGTDKIHVFSYGKNELVLEKTIEATPGAGPRMLEFSSEHDVFYAINELNDTISVYSNTDSPIKLLQELSTYQSGTSEAGAASHIALTGEQKYLVASNRVKNSLAVFELDKGLLKNPVWFDAIGDHPRHFTFTSDTDFLLAACSDSGFIQSIRFKEGTIEDTGCRCEVPNPTCIVEAAL